MSVREAAWWAVGFGVALVLLFGLFLLSEGTVVSRAVRSVQQTYEPAAAQSALLNTSISDMQRGVTAFVLTGEESDLRAYVDGSRRSDIALQQLGLLLGGDEQLADLVDVIDQDRQRWLTEVSRPTLQARRAGDTEAALAVLQSADSAALYVDLQADSATLQALIDDRSNASFALLTSRTYRLLRTVVLAVFLLMIGLTVFIVVTHRKLLVPLDGLREQIRDVARSSTHTRPIRAAGPKELQELGADVEELRRKLVWEIDEARSARQALDQKAPVVSAIRAELAAGPPARAAGLLVAGALQPAEGVLAGDWWDSAVLPTGEVAVVVADIAGHGAEAGIAAMRLKQAIVHDLNAGLDIDAIARSAAEVFQSHPDRFATVAAVCVDPGTGAVRYINAGHHAPLLLGEDGAVARQLDRTGPILSWLGGSWSIGTERLLPGESLLLFSDGLIESHDDAGEELGEDLLASWLSEVPAGQRRPADLVPWLIGAARQRAVDWDRDDVTVVALQRIETDETPVAAPTR